jgi:hypothetical protein
MSFNFAESDSKAGALALKPAMPKEVTKPCLCFVPLLCLKKPIFGRFGMFKRRGAGA